MDKNLQKKIIILFITLIILGSFSSIIYSHLSAQKYAIKQANNLLEETTHSRGEHIETVIKEKINILTIISENILIEEYLTQEHGHSIEEVQNELNEFVDKTIVSISLANPNNTIIISSDNTSIGEKIEYEKMDYYTEEENDIIFFKNMYHDTNLNKNFFELNKFIIDDNSNKPLGILNLKISSEVIEKITTNRIGLGTSGEIYIINENGYLITRRLSESNPDLKTKIDTKNSIECIEDLKISDEEVQEKNDIKLFKNQNQVLILGTDAVVAETKWCILGEITKKELYQSTNELLIKSVITTLIILLVTLSIFILSISKLFSKQHKTK